jgi:hypothetical protein
MVQTFPCHRGIPLRLTCSCNSRRKSKCRRRSSRNLIYRSGRSSTIPAASSWSCACSSSDEQRTVNSREARFIIILISCLCTLGAHVLQRRRTRMRDLLGGHLGAWPDHKMDGRNSPHAITPRCWTKVLVSVVVGTNLFLRSRSLPSLHHGINKAQHKLNTRMLALKSVLSTGYKRRGESLRKRRAKLLRAIPPAQYRRMTSALCACHSVSGTLSNRTGNLSANWRAECFGGLGLPLCQCVRREQRGRSTEFRMFAARAFQIL